MGPTLRFIFQQDSNNPNLDQFAICRFVSDSLKVVEEAPGLYSVSVSFEESW